MSQHPSFKSDEELKALRAADPAAFDDDESGDVEETAEAKAERERDEQGRFKAKDEAKADEPPAEVVDEAKPDAPKVDDAKPEDAKPDEAKADGIPKPRFDEVIAERNRERDARLAAERRVAELEAAQAAANTKDYDAEIEALNFKYDEGDVDFAKYQKDMAALIAEKTKAEVLAEVARKDAEKQQQTVQQQYDAARDKFFAEAEHKELIGTRTREVAFADAIQQVFEAGSAKTYDEVFVLAAEIVKRDFPTARAETPDPHAARKAADAAAASKASAAPPTINGGVGNRGNVENVVDLKTMKAGRFSKNLSAADQEKLLGEGAL